MLRILLADDHSIVRRGLKELLEEHVGWSVCAEAATGREAVEMAIEHRPQIAVLDLSMPELNGLEATRRIRQAVPETEVLVFTMHESDELVREVLAAGARGYLLKSDAADQLVPAVESLARHQAVLHRTDFGGRPRWLPQGRRRGGRLAGDATTDVARARDRPAACRGT